jgi:molecular chaperone DnaK
VELRGVLREPVIGIDLGTSNSVVATVDRGRPEVIPNRQGARLTPSMVGFLPSGERVLGEAARELAKELPENVAFQTKRFIGRRWSRALAAAARQVVPYPLVAGPQEEIRVKLAGRTLPVTQISAMVLLELKLDAQAHFGRPVHKAVITVPANFDDGQRKATKEAARIAGLEVLRLINEPTAAAVAYGLSQDFRGSCLVFDLGGGTFDVSILEVQNGVFEVKATGGDPLLGGADFDKLLMDLLLDQLPLPAREAVLRHKPSLERLRVAAEQAKCRLSEAAEVEISVDGLGEPSRARAPAALRYTLSRAAYEDRCLPLVDKCLNTCGQVLAEARYAAERVDTVLMVGGMTRMPLVRRMVGELFGQDPNTQLNPDEVVALGAALQAGEVSQQSRAALLIDVASHSLGVGIVGGSMRRLIAKNTAVPVSAKEVFVPGHAGQAAARIPIFQGEAERCVQNVKLGELVLRGLEGEDRAARPIEVVFELSQDAILSVRATDVATGLSEAVRLEAQTGLSEAEERRLAKEQQAYAERRGAEDLQRSQQGLRRMLERGQKLVSVLEARARAAPGPDTQAALVSMKALLDFGRAALVSGDLQEVAAVRRRLVKVLRADRPAAA